MNDKVRAAWMATKSSAKRELGLFVFMMIFGLCAGLVALPIIFVMTLLPDWTWWLLAAALVIWVLFGETITAAVRAYREQQP